MSEPEERLLGIPAVDRRLLPVLPPGGLLLVLGNPGSGAALLAKQFAAAGAGDAPVVYLTTNERTEDVERAFQDFGWDAGALRILNLDAEYFDRVLARNFDVSRARERGLSLADVAAPSAAGPPEPPYNVAARILTELGALESRFRFALDSVDFLSELLEPAELIALARQVRHRAIALGGRALLVLQTKTVDDRTLGLLEEMADLVVEVTAEPDGERFRHRLALRKVRNHPERARMVRCRVTAKGFELADERDPEENEEPVPAGRRARERATAAGSAVN